MDSRPLNSFIETKEVRARTESKATNDMPGFSKKIASFLSLYLHLFKLYVWSKYARCSAYLFPLENKNP
jgi:hypothetical protein